MEFPLIRPNPPRLSLMGEALAAIEAAGVYSNNGPVLQRLETALTAHLFAGRGECLGVANATLGLMIAIRQAALGRPGRYALMPSFTFAATALAADWAGLTPLLCDIDRADWAASAAAEDALIARHGEDIAVVLPYATFGNRIDLDRYERLAERHGVVVDAAASLGLRDADGAGFAAGRRFATVFSLHATKTFATGEGGIIHSGDAGVMADLRAMTNFGFAEPRSASLPGMNAKMSEVEALLALAKLDEIDAVVAHRSALVAAYRARLGGFDLQRADGADRVAQFMPVLLPPALAPQRGEIIAGLASTGVGAATYFSPHLAEQPWFAANARSGPLPVTRDVAARVVALPITEAMTVRDVAIVCDRFLDICAAATGLRRRAA